MNLNELHKTNDREIQDKKDEKFNVSSNVKEISTIYSSTFSLVGMDFLDALMQEITIQTKVDSTLLLQLLSPEEYKDITSISKEDKYHLISSSSISTTSSPEITYSTSLNDELLQNSTKEYVDSIPDFLQDKFLLIRSCFSNQVGMKASLSNTVIPISSLNSKSPYLKTLLNAINNTNGLSCLSNQHTDLELEDVERGVYPDYQQYIGLKLESIQKDKRSIKGILCVTDKKETMDSNKLNSITTILNTVHLRCINELNQLQQQEKLISARDIAVIDAENKLKFLADMSHEIRTPMNAVIALTDLLLQEKATLNIEQIEHLEVIQTSGSHLLTIINDILDISKLNHDPKFKLESRRFSLRKCLKDTLNMARHQASMSQQNKVIYVLEGPPDKDDNIPLPQLISQLENKGILLRPLLNRKGKTVLPLIWKIDSDVPDHLLGDAMRLTQIMLNLCSNATKFTKQGGIQIRIKKSTPAPLRSSSKQSEKSMSFKERHDAKIETIWNQAIQDGKKKSTIYNPNLSPGASSSSNPSAGLVGSSEESDNLDYFGEKTILEISVTDTGIGIPADRLPKLFKSFSQIDISTARRYGGTGLGLAISSTLVNRMGGCVWVESEENVGSRFALTLPMTIASRSRNYSHDGIPLGFLGSPSSPGSTISDSSGSVHSTVCVPTPHTSSTTHDIPSPMYNFSSPTVNNLTSHTSYFPPTPVTTTSFNPQRPIFSRSNSQHTISPDTCHSRTIESPIPPPSNEIFSHMAEDPLSQYPPSSTPLLNELEDLKRSARSNSGTVGTNSSSTGSNIRKSYNELLSPASRTGRIGISKQHYHNNRKPQVNKEENLAIIYPLRILLAEDNILNQKIAVSILKRLGYVDVAIANNGREVLTLMKTSVFDIIFMDLYMPEMDGLEVTREIVKDRIRQKSNHNSTETNQTDLLNAIDVYIIALTASASREDRQICIDAGMNDFISKPFTMTEMKSALKTCVSKRKKRRKVSQKSNELEDKTTTNNIVEDPIEENISESNISNTTTDDPMLDIQPANNNQII